MSVSLKISPRIIPSISTIYTDPNRIFMEYIDNAIDNADQNWYFASGNKYTKEINIRVIFTGKNYREGKVTIIDNCNGISNFKKVVESIGNSDKRQSAITNGQFGYGMHSYMAACENLQVTSREKGRDAYVLKLSRSMFDQDNVEDVAIPDEKVSKGFRLEPGTEIVLSSFDSDKWREVSVENLKKEIEHHFELILVRPNLKVTLVDNSGTEHQCQPFDYSKFEGAIWEDHIEHLHYSKGSKTEVVHLNNPVKIFLKITTGSILNRPPVFVSKGRRICEIKDVKSFKTKHRSDIWGHSNVSGYIDLQGFLGPTIARTDFKNDKNSKALYEALYELEPVILDEVKRINNISDQQHYQKLEDVLNKALSKLAKMDAMNFRTTFLKGGDTPLAGGSLGTNFEDEGGLPDFGETKTETDGPDVGDEGEGGVGQSEDGEQPGGQTEGDNAKNEPQFADTDFTGKERKRSGFNIRISDADPQIDADTNKPLRSMLSGDEIVIFKKHEDFQRRVRPSRQGDSKITHRLLAYIAGEITVHYKDQFYNKHENGQPEYNKHMFVSMAEFMYQLEDILAPLDNKNLSELS